MKRLLLVLPILLCGCKTLEPKPPEMSSPVAVAKISEDITQAQSSNQQAKVVVESMPASTQRGVALVHIDHTEEHLVQAKKDTNIAQETVKNDAKVIETQGKQIEDLKKDDPFKSWLTLIGIVCTVGGLVIVIGSWLNPIFKAFDWVGYILLPVGLACATLVRFLDTFYLICLIALIAGLVAGMIYLLVYAIKKHQYAQGLVTSLEAAKDAELITWNDDLKALLKKWQGKVPGLEEFVNKVQGK